MRTVSAAPRAAAVLCALAALVLTGCSGGDSGDGSGSGRTSSKATVSADVTAYYSCLKKNGLTLQTTNGGEPRIVKDQNVNDTASVTAAQEKCRDRMPAPSAVPASVEDLTAARELSACVREKGFTEYPDPDPKTGEVPAEAAEAAEALKSDPGLVSALLACTSGAGVSKG